MLPYKRHPGIRKRKRKCIRHLHRSDGCCILCAVQHIFQNIHAARIQCIHHHVLQHAPNGCRASSFHRLEHDDKLHRRIACKELDFYDVEELIYEIKNYDITITGLKDFEQAQVCAGGVLLNQLSNKTLMSIHHEGLYFAGEVIDIDGICGGYNITFAMLSGKKAGESAYAKTKSN